MNSPYEQALNRIDELTASRDQIENKFNETQKSLRECIKDADRYETLWIEACDKLREKDKEIKRLAAMVEENDTLLSDMDLTIYNLRSERDAWKAVAERWRKTYGPERDAWKAEAERWRKLSDNTSLGRIDELESAVDKWHTSCREKDADIDKLLAQRDQAFAERDNMQAQRDEAFAQRDEAFAERDEAIRERDTESKRATHNMAIAVEREGERKRLEAHIQEQHVASWEQVQDALGTDFRVNGNSLVEDTVNAINGFRDACELLDLIHDATNLREEVEP